MLELLSPIALNGSSERARLLSAGIKGGWNYVLDHAWLLARIESHIQTRSEPALTVFDVGCGNSMFHPFLEKELNLGVIGVDRIDGLCPHPGRTPIIDFAMDFIDFSRRFESAADIVFWLSSIEHNPVELQRECVDASLRLLKPGGLFLATFGFAPTTHYFEASEQTNLSVEDAEFVFDEKWITAPDFDAMVAEYRQDLMELDTRHVKRYGTRDYAFLVAGASKRKAIA